MTAPISTLPLGSAPPYVPPAARPFERLWMLSPRDSDAVTVSAWSRKAGSIAAVETRRGGSR